MALSRVQYEQIVSGNKNFTVPMPYISRDHIKVSVDGVDVPFSWLNDNIVQLHTAPPLGAIIDVRRETERNVILVDFQDASTITEQQLDLAARQSFYLAQEAFDLTYSTMAVANDGSYSASGRRLSMLGYPNSDDDAANVKYVKDVLVSGKDAFEERLLAEAARNKAQQWADASENVQVESGKYSARHHAAKASQSAAAAAASEANALTYRDQANAHKNSASTSASNAASSATAAANSATTATNEAARAKSEADRAQSYANGMNLPPATGNGGKLLMQKGDETGLVYIAQGSGGGLDADLLDGHHASEFMRASKLSQGVNLNSVVEAGAYRLTESHPNRPSDSVNYGQLLVVRGGGDTITQIVTDYRSNRLFWRSGNPTQVGGTGSWQPWREIFHTGNTSVSFGSNGYVKWPNGLIFQWFSTGYSSSYSTDSQTVYFPVAFPNACLGVVSTIRWNYSSSHAPRYHSPTGWTASYVTFANTLSGRSILAIGY